MPTAAELVLYGSLNIPDDDTSTAGGAIDVASRPLDSPLASTQETEVVSDGADTRTGTLRFRNAAGAIVSEAFTLNGTTAVSIPNGPAERILDITLDSTSATRTVTLRVASAGATIHTVGTDEDFGYRLFRNASSDPSTTETRYEILYWKNTHGSEDLTSAVSRIASGGDASSNYEIGIATAQGDVGTITNRETAPGGITFVDDAVDQNVPGTGDLAAGARVAVYLKQTLSAAEAAAKETVTVELQGTSV